MSGEQQQFGQEDGNDKFALIKRIGVIAIILAVLGGLGYALKGLLDSPGPQKREITTIKLVPDTPPPPPPPPPKEPPKEVPKEAPKEIKEAPPKPKQEETPPAEQLKMEGAAGDGPSPFAAGQVTEEYKGGEISNAPTIGGGPSKYQFAWYTDLIKEQIENAISKDKSLASGSYKVIVTVRVKSDGKIEFISSNADQDKAELVRKAFAEMPALLEPPPSDMPQPVKLRVTARSLG